MFKFFKSSYLDNHLSESVHIWTGTLESRLSFHESWPQGPCPGLGLEVKIQGTFKKRLTTCLSVIKTTFTYAESWSDVWPKNKYRSLWSIFYGPVILLYILKTSSCMMFILWDYESVRPNIWPQNKCRSLWPTFHGPVILCFCVCRTTGPLVNCLVAVGILS